MVSFDPLHTLRTLIPLLFSGLAEAQHGKDQAKGPACTKQSEEGP
jgi:hypothetical protein